MKPTFEHIGPVVDFGDVQIDSDQAEVFRKNALQGTKIHKLLVDDEFSYVWTASYATGVLSSAAADYDVPESAFYAKSFSGMNPDYWRSVVTFARYNQKHADTKIYNVYEVEAHAGEVTSAVRRVRIIRNLSRLTFNQAGEPYEDTYSRQRKSFETPMQPEDVELVSAHITRIMNRQRVTSRG
ncbi:hypothetical protein H7100_03395 [Candidatus Saccharibacteria bacterium]|nr:hypothetical protein [Candidatus Saccharibacteria bacterium]